MKMMNINSQAGGMAVARLNDSLIDFVINPISGSAWIFVFILKFILHPFSTFKKKILDTKAKKIEQ